MKNAKEKLSDGLVIAMILKGLPDAYKPFVVHVTQKAQVKSHSQCLSVSLKALKKPKNSIINQRQTKL